MSVKGKPDLRSVTGHEVRQRNEAMQAIRNAPILEAGIGPR
jgi:hypothetical protein